MLHSGPRSYYTLGRTFPRTFTREPFRKKAHGPILVALYKHSKQGVASIKSNASLNASLSATWGAKASLSARITLTALDAKTAGASATIKATASVIANSKELQVGIAALKGSTTITAIANCSRKATVSIKAISRIPPTNETRISANSTLTAIWAPHIGAGAHLSGNTMLYAFFAVANLSAKTKIIASGSVVGQFVHITMSGTSSVTASATMNPHFICNTGYVCKSRPFGVKKCYPMVFIVAEKTKYHQKPTGAFLPAITQCQQNEVIT